jgi:predicted nucleic acid-binding protein
LKILVDTPVWSLSLRRKPKDLHADEKRRVDALAFLVRDGNAVLIGPIRQELLSGIREGAVFERLREALRAFPDEPLVTDDFEEAARASNVCRSSGIAGSAVDFLICAVALRRKLEIFTLDHDFDQYAKHLPLRLHEPRRKPAR